MSINYQMLPQHMRDGAKLYIEHGIPPGSFMRAVICNDLMESFGRADDINRECMHDHVKFWYCEAPSNCHGDEAAYLAWVAHDGMAGRDKAKAVTQ